MSDTPETDQVEKYDGFKMKESVTTCGDESSSVYINVLHARRLERGRNKARKDAEQLADKLSGLELRTTEELANMEQERNEANQKLKIATEQWELCIDLAKKYQQERDEWKDITAKLVNIASYALGEFNVQLTLDQQRIITETMRQYHSLLKKK
jgi:hypothetical protein